MALVMYLGSFLLDIDFHQCDPWENRQNSQFGNKKRDGMDMKHPLKELALSLIERCVDMTVATVRPDGMPQATIVSYVHDGLLLYFGCGGTSQKAANIAAEPRISIALAPEYRDWQTIQGLSMAAIAEEVTVKGELETVGKLMLKRFPQIRDMQAPEGITLKVFRVRPTVISVLDYTKGFGHTDLVSVDAGDIAETLETMRHHWLMPVQ